MDNNNRTRNEQFSRYTKRLKHRFERLQTESQTLSRYRALTLIGGGILSTIAFNVHSLAGWGVGFLAAVGFSLLVVRHRKLVKGIRRLEHWLSIKQTHLARLTLDWLKLQAPKSDAVNNHPFAFDLNLIGSRSLHQLLNTAISHGGQRRLSEWLLNAPRSNDRIQHRQTLVKEVIQRSTFRDKLLLHTRIVQQRSGPWDGEQIQRWLQAHEGWTPQSWLLKGLLALTALYIPLYLLNQVFAIPAYWMIPFGLYVIVYLSHQRHIAPLLHEAAALESILTQVAEGFRYLESHSYHGQPELKKLLEPFLSPDKKPSKQLKRVARITSAASIRGNPLVWLFANLLMPWDLILVHFLQRYKSNLANVLPQWLDVWYELETICALANFAYLNPDYVFPDIENSDHQPVFNATSLGHPLLLANQKVCNDFNFNALGDMVIVTGSNMSGKSTFLRTLGVNLCLAYAGAPVNAAQFQCNRFRIFACIQVSDSLADGLSYFYAEVKRLKQLLDALNNDEELPLFFLIDEIFRGTNNRERLLGSRAYVKALAGQHGVGLLSTHDLELVQLADQFDEIENYHFRETIEDGLMKFDYQLHHGPCPTTNALTIMQLEGLPIEIGSEQHLHDTSP
jgi:hypothetical protein